jgi:flagellar biosynthesis/type III secretory pathway chaperone
LIEGKAEVLSENARLQEKQVFALTPIVGRRNELLAKMAKLNGVKVMGLTDVLNKAPLDVVEEFKKTFLELVQSGKKLGEANQSNEKLLNNALSFTDFTLNIIRDGGKQKTFMSSGAKEEKKSSFVNRIA